MRLIATDSSSAFFYLLIFLLFSVRLQMYQELGTVVQLSMSADATCRGLRTPRDGPLVMEFTKGITHAD